MTDWTNRSLPRVLEACERMEHHLTAGIVSNNHAFVQEVQLATTSCLSLTNDVVHVYVVLMVFVCGGWCRSASARCWVQRLTARRLRADWPVLPAHHKTTGG